MKARNIIASFLIIAALMIISGAAGGYSDGACNFSEWIAWEIIGFAAMIGAYFCFDESIRT